MSLPQNTSSMPPTPRIFLRPFSFTYLCVTLREQCYHSMLQASIEYTTGATWLPNFKTRQFNLTEAIAISVRHTNEQRR